MKLKFAAFVAAVSIAAFTPAAQAQGIGVEATGANAHDRWGGELGIGYAVKLGPVSLRPIGGVFVHRGDNYRYYEDTFNNGQSRCRDSQTGQFARDSDCVNVAAKWYGKVEATFNIPLVAEVGGGVRFSDEKARPYGTVAIAMAPKLKLKGNAGDNYFALGVNFGF